MKNKAALVPMIKTELIINKIGSMYQKYLNLLEINDETGVMVRFVDIQKFINHLKIFQ